MKNEAGDPYLKFSFSPGAFVYLSAQNKGYGALTCRIRAEDGSVIAENTANGQYAIATCTGQAP
jgi:hypothetical protein